MWRVELRENCIMCKKPVPKDKRFRTYCSKVCRTRYYNMKTVATPEARAISNAGQRERWRKKHIDGKPTVKCLICNKEYRQVGSHIAQSHKMTAREYRRLYGFDVKKGIIPDDLRELYQQQVRDNHTIDNLKAGAPFRFKKGDPRAGNYKRSDQSIMKLRQNAEKLRSNKLFE